MFYRKDDLTGIMASCAARIRSSLRAALTLTVKHKGIYMLVDTNVPEGVPTIVREWSSFIAKKG